MGVSAPAQAFSCGVTGFRNAEGEVDGRVSIMSGVLPGLDPKPGELPMARLKPR